jgi:L-aminopeptidase/D-esterase-like protein
LFAQQPGLQAFSLATFERMHDRAETGVAATGNVIATKSDIAILLSTALTS